MFVNEMGGSKYQLLNVRDFKNMPWRAVWPAYVYPYVYLYYTLVYLKLLQKDLDLCLA